MTLVQRPQPDHATPAAPAAGSADGPWSTVRRHREAWLVGIVALVVLAAHLWSGQYGLDQVDEGYFLSLADRVKHGALPYRDFDTYYTPGIFSLYALLFKLFGTTVATTRALIAVEWACLWLLLYGLTRRVAPPPFAALPFAILAVVEPSPVWPSAHPGWPALLCVLLALELVMRHQRSGRRRWLALAAAIAALGFLFKQNVGAFTALGVGGYVLLHRGIGAGRLLRIVGLAYVLLVALAAAVLLRPGLDLLLATSLLLPLIATAVLVLVATRTTPLDTPLHGARALLVDTGIASAAFVGVTLLWLVPLTLALGPDHTPLALFVGQVNQGALVVPLQQPPHGTPAAVLVATTLTLAATALTRSRNRGAWWASATLAATALLLWLSSGGWDPAAATLTSADDPWPKLVDFELGWLFLYLPAASAWAAFIVLVRRSLKRRPLDGVGPWYLWFGTLANLALYPRVDPLHAMLAGAPLLVVGAWVLSCAHRVLSGTAGRAGQALVLVALLTIPLAAATPLAYARYNSLTRANPEQPAPAVYVPLDLQRAAVLVNERTALEVGGTVRYLQAHSEPDEPVLAYPMLPMINFLADRPNPTRFNHFLPGALTPDDMAEVIASLEANPPRFVVWDHAGVLVWETDSANRPLTDYLWRCYNQVESFGLYLVLERHAC